MLIYILQDDAALRAALILLVLGSILLIDIGRGGQIQLTVRMVRGDVGCTIGKDGRRDGTVLHTLLTDGLFLERAGREERPADGSRNTGSGGGGGRGLHALLDGTELLLDATKRLAGGGGGNVGNVVLLGGRDASVGTADLGGTAAAATSRLADDEILCTRCHGPDRRDTGIVAHQIARILGVNARLFGVQHSLIVFFELTRIWHLPIWVLAFYRRKDIGRCSRRHGGIVESLENGRIYFRLAGGDCRSRHGCCQ